MKYIAAGLTAIVVFLLSYSLLIFVEEPALNLMGWQTHDPFPHMGWWRAGVGLIMASCVFHFYVEWRNSAALKWRKTLASRARA
jgi:hypothetical protein